MVSLEPTCSDLLLNTHSPVSNEYEKGTEKERLLEAPSMGMLSVLPNDALHPESEGKTKRRWRRSTLGCLKPRKEMILFLNLSF